MGLRADFTVFDLGYAEATSIETIFIDYSYGCQVFADTFISVAKDLVPVYTGHLRSTITASASDDGCCCETDCDYAQYVEYGTVYMGAQPYFEPALSAALNAATPYWDEAVDLALAEEQSLLEEAAAAEREGSRGGGRGGGGRSFGGGIFGRGIGGFIGAALGVLFFTWTFGLIGLILSDGMNVGSSSGGGSRGGSSHTVGGDDLRGYGAGIPVEIT